MRLNLSTPYPSLTQTCLGFLSFFLLVVSSHAQPIVDLGPDVGACDMLLLDAGNPGASYVWSTTETTQSIQVSVSGIYWVDVTDTNGTSRDSVEVDIVSTPVAPTVSDLSICGPGEVTLSAQSNSDEVLWYDHPTSNRPIASGNQVSLFISDSTTLYTEANNYAPIDTVGLPDFGSSTQFFVIGSRGITFDVFTPSVLKSVKVFSDQPGSMRIQLENSSGTILDSLTIHVTESSFTETIVPLFFDLPVGTGFKLVGENVSGGFGMIFGTTPYPFDIPGVVSLTGSITNATDRYAYFFDWAVTTKICSSPQTPVQVDVLPSPVVNLGLDTALCGGSLTLDATNPGATYLWSTGSTNPTIVVSSSDTVSVETSIGTCAVSDTIIVEVLSTPASPTVADASICGPDSVFLSAQSSSDEILWFEGQTDTRPIASGNQVPLFISTSTTLYAQANNYATIDTSGLPDFGSSNQFFVVGSRGITFDVFTPSVLKSVKVFTDQAGSMRIQLENSSGTILDSVTIHVSETSFTETIVPLFFDLPVGTGYRLMGTNVTGGFGMIFGTTPFPFTIPGVVSLTGATSNDTDRYTYFFDWAITKKICASPQVPVQIDVLPSPVVNLGLDTALCGGSLTLDASNTGATYLWSTGATGSSIVVTTTDTVSVEASVGNCSESDTIIVEILTTPGPPTVSDTSICGPGSINVAALSTAEEVLWYDDPASSRPIASGHQISLFVPDSTTIYAEANNYASIDTVGLPDFGSADQFFVIGTRGITFDVITPALLKSIKVFSNQAGSMRIQLENSSGTILDSITIHVTETSFTETIVPLFFDLPAETGLRLIGENVSGGFGMIFGQTAYPFDIPGVISLTGSITNATDRYTYFFDWAVTKKVCASPMAPMQINVLEAPEFNLGFDRAICGDSFVLDASSPGASYLWNTGATTSSITVSQTDTFSVVANIGACVKGDTVFLEFVPEPLSPIPFDTTVCGNGEVFFTTQSGGDEFLWYEGQSDVDFLLEGDSLFQFIQDTTTLFVEAINHSTVNQVGIANFSPPQAAFQPSLRGISFDVFQPLVLKSVQMYSDGPTEALVLLENSAGIPLDSMLVFIEDDLGTNVPLYFDLPVGNGFRLVAKNITGGNLAFYFNNISYPYVIPNQISLTAANNGATNNYYYFFDWEIVQKVCISPRIPVTVTVALPLNLGDDIYSCDPVTLNTLNPSATHIWNTGAVTPSIQAGETGKYWVEISDNMGCVSVDTIEVEIPTLDLGEDGIICGTTLFTGYDSTSVFEWNTGAMTPDLPLINPGTYWVRVNEPLGCVLEDTIVVSGFADFPMVDLGMDFSECDSAVLDAGNPGNSFLWSTGDTTQMISIYTVGIISVDVTNEFGCTTTDEISVFITPSPTAEFVYNSNGATIFFENLSSLGSNFWDFGDGNTSNLSSPVHTYQDTGMYTVRLILIDILNNCGSDTFYSTIHITSLTSADALLNTGTIRTYPNPVSDHVFVRFEQVPSGHVSFQLLDMRGRAVLNKQIFLLDPNHIEVLSIPSVSQGLYQLKVQTEEGFTIHKLMIR
ncbi:MAG: T9SS type A sorting domain-containing protein [Bacteroidota bacterium]